VLAPGAATLPHSPLTAADRDSLTAPAPPATALRDNPTEPSIAASSIATGASDDFTVPLASITHAAPIVPATAPTAASAADLRAETAWLSRVESALRQRDPRRALLEWDAEHQRFEHGQLRDEQAGLRLIAQCMLGREVTASLQRYLATVPGGVLSARVRRACQAENRRGP
jgi:hypothetical protein